MRKIRMAFICTVISFAASALLPKTLSAQEWCSISGTLCDTTGRAITDVTAVVIMSRADSMTLKMEYVRTGSFNIPYPPPAGEAIVYISSYGFESRFLPLKGAHNDLGKIVLRPLQIAVESVVVEAIPPIGHEFIRGKDRFSIPEALGKGIFDLDMLLERVPGLTYDGQSISIVGRGDPAYLINGFQPRSGELQTIRPEDVERVEVDRMPSARYNKSVRGIINIITRNRKYDYLNGYVMNDFTYRKYVENTSTVTLNNKMGRWVNYIGYRYGYAEPKAQMLYETTLHGSDGDMRRISNEILRNTNNSHSLNLSPKYQINNKSFIDLQYSLGKSKVDAPGIRTYDVEGLEFSNINSNARSDNTNHSVLLRYGSRFNDDHILSVSVGYLRVDNKGDNFTHEHVKRYSDGAFKDLETHYKSGFNSDALSAVANYQFPIGKNLSCETGGDFSRIWNSSRTEYIGAPVDNGSSTTTETQASAYFNFGQAIKKFYYQVGVRGEYLHKIGTDGKRVDEAPFSFLPTVSLSYSFSNQTNLSLYFRRSTTHPSVSQRDPILHYSNRYEWAQGNPNLKSSARSELSLNLSLPKNLAMSMEYSHVKNDIIHVYDLYEEEASSTILTYQNFPAYNGLSAGISWYSNNYGPYYMRIDASYSQTWSESPFLNGFVRYDQPMFRGTLRQFINFGPDGKYGRFSIMGSYTTASDYTTGHMDANWNLGASMFFKFLKDKRLQVTISANKLLYNDYKQTSKYKRISARNVNRMFDRSVSFSISYSFNNYKSMFNRNNSNSNAMQRAQ